MYASAAETLQVEKDELSWGFKGLIEMYDLTIFTSPFLCTCILLLPCVYQSYI